MSQPLICSDVLVSRASYPACQNNGLKKPRWTELIQVFRNELACELTAGEDEKQIDYRRARNRRMSESGDWGRTGEAPRFVRAHQEPVRKLVMGDRLDLRTLYRVAENNTDVSQWSLLGMDDPLQGAAKR